MSRKKDEGDYSVIWPVTAFEQQVGIESGGVLIGLEINNESKGRLFLSIAQAQKLMDRLRYAVDNSLSLALQHGPATVTTASEVVEATAIMAGTDISGRIGVLQFEHPDGRQSVALGPELLEQLRTLLDQIESTMNSPKPPAN
ncbi:hypothetical protein [Hansschlegelia beijingensis]|uniref:CRISPR/Cas system-associated exonuclease Cas4 (RecB family) n=1 Tax=Hansschlegelia beijingensis TaxID=1133344 RepID=A0A7W6GFC6_9HYPH|nr:hypothetical protein [Hansschlegelia beijingensis]MBB3972797.1 CRISPR/Cas system-associated exonuclease Cas4 (RecB family) [Hansschlegelia beijingensis]